MSPIERKSRAGPRDDEGEGVFDGVTAEESKLARIEEHGRQLIPSKTAVQPQGSRAQGRCNARGETKASRLYRSHCLSTSIQAAIQWTD
jgi:hypothetical protein